MARGKSPKRSPGRHAYVQGKHRKVHQNQDGSTYVMVPYVHGPTGSVRYSRKRVSGETHALYGARNARCLRSPSKRCVKVSSPMGRKLIASSPNKAALEALLAQCRMGPNKRCVVKKAHRSPPKKKAYKPTGRPRGRPRGSPRGSPLKLKYD